MESVQAASEAWEKSAACKTLAALDAFLAKGGPATKSPWMPWNELKQALRSLPATLD